MFTITFSRTWALIAFVGYGLLWAALWDLLFRKGQRPMPRVDEAKDPLPAVKDVLGAIPAHCKERSAFWSSTYIVRDVVCMALVAKAVCALGMASGGALHAERIPQRRQDSAGEGRVRRCASAETCF